MFGCKKDEDLNDPTIYLWKRELFSDVALNPLKNPKDSSSGLVDYLVSTDYVYLTKAQAKEQERKKKRDGTTLFYTFTRM